jgi:hypothetical protein
MFHVSEKQKYQQAYIAAHRQRCHRPTMYGKQSISTNSFCVSDAAVIEVYTPCMFPSILERPKLAMH